MDHHQHGRLGPCLSIAGLERSLVTAMYIGFGGIDQIGDLPGEGAEPQGHSGFSSVLIACGLAISGSSNRILHVGTSVGRASMPADAGGVMGGKR